MPRIRHFLKRAVLCYYNELEENCQQFHLTTGIRYKESILLNNYFEQKQI